MSNLDIPYIIYHHYCGKPIFYYFGSESNALKLKDINSISTMDLCSVMPENLAYCAVCNMPISTNNISIYNKNYTKPNENDTKDLVRLMEEKIKQMQMINAHKDTGSSGKSSYDLLVEQKAYQDYYNKFTHQEYAVKYSIPKYDIERILPIYPIIKNYDVT